MADIPLDDQIACVKREIAMRGRVYPRFVASGKMSQENARREHLRMEAVLETLLEAKKAELLL